MNFLIFRDFSKFILDFKSIKTIKKYKKRFIFHAGPTWMRRDTQGHVAKPRGPTRAPACRGGDTCAYLYLLDYHVSTYNIGL